MKKVIMATCLLQALCYVSFSQTIPPSVGSTLIFHGDAACGYVSGSSWYDLSGNNNHVNSVGSSYPAFNANVLSGPFPGLTFDGVDDYLESISFPATGANGTSATIFAVRIAANHQSEDIPSVTNVQSIVSVAENNKYNDEFGLTSDWAVHHASTGWFSYRPYDNCYTSLPTTRPVILTARLGATSGYPEDTPPGNPDDVELFINGMKSSTFCVGSSPNCGLNFSTLTPTAPPPYSPVPREIIVGARYNNSSILQEFFDGDILEVLVYNTDMSDADVATITEWLKCKYEVDYLACGETAPNCNIGCHKNPKLSAVFTGFDGSGNCQFEARVSAPPNSPYTNYSDYHWNDPGNSYTWTLTGSGIETFVMAPGTGTVDVSIFGYDSSNDVNLEYCCGLTLHANLTCDATYGGRYE